MRQKNISSCPQEVFAQEVDVLEAAADDLWPFDPLAPTRPKLRVLCTTAGCLTPPPKGISPIWSCQSAICFKFSVIIID